MNKSGTMIQTVAMAGARSKEKQFGRRQDIATHIHTHTLCRFTWLAESQVNSAPGAILVPFAKLSILVRLETDGRISNELHPASLGKFNLYLACFFFSLSNNTVFSVNLKLINYLSPNRLLIKIPFCS